MMLVSVGAVSLLACKRVPEASAKCEQAGLRRAEKKLGRLAEDAYYERAQLAASAVLQACKVPELEPIVRLNAGDVPRSIVGPNTKWDEARLRTCPAWIEVNREIQAGGKGRALLEWQRCHFLEREVLTYEEYERSPGLLPYVVYDMLVRDGLPTRTARALARPLRYTVWVFAADENGHHSRALVPSVHQEQPPG
jgi:hypothetical protein